MSEIDWSKAPEGATYCAPEGLSREPQVCWYRRHEGRWEYFSPNRREWRLSANGPEFHDRLIPRPTQWRGPEDGLPPVGSMVKVVCTASQLGSGLARFADTEVRVAGHFVAHRGGRGMVIDHPSHGVGAIMYHAEFFAPLKSDKERAVEAVLKATPCRTLPRTVEAIVGDLYDAGLLRLPEDQS